MSRRPRFYEPEEGMFRGYAPFKERHDEGKIHPGQQVRVYDSGRMANEEGHYVIGSEGRAFDEEQKPIDLEKILDEAESWSFEGCNLAQLPAEEIEQLPQ